MVLVIDSAVQVDHRELTGYGVEVCNYPLYVDGEPYPVSIDMSDDAKEAIRLLLKDKNRKLSTSGLREDDLLAIYRRHPDERIISLHQSSAASTASTQVIAKIIREHPELDIVHVDARHLCSGYSVIVRETARRIQAGAGTEEIERFLQTAPERTRHLGLVFDLFYLNRTGRIGLAKAIMGTAVKIIPILASSDPPGSLKSAGKVKTPAQANRRFLDIIKAHRDEFPGSKMKAVISVIGPHAEEAEELKAFVSDLGGDVEVMRYGTNHSNLPHIGPDFYDIGYMFTDD